MYLNKVSYKTGRKGSKKENFDSTQKREAVTSFETLVLPTKLKVMILFIMQFPLLTHSFFLL
jgi:hypothetical protein